MKKIVALILVSLMLLCTTATAESIDLSTMTKEELIALIDNARLELTKYLPVAEEGTVLHEDELVRITYTSMELDDYDSLLLNVVVENLTDSNVYVSLQNASCNGWSVWEGVVEVPANKKAKVAFDFMDAVIDAELESVEDVQDIEGDLLVMDSDTYENLADEVHVLWNFK